MHINRKKFWNETQQPLNGSKTTHMMHSLVDKFRNF